MQENSRYVIYTEELGIYLGNCMGLGFWSKWDPVGQDYAVTFGSKQDCEDHVTSWGSKVEGWEAVPVSPDKDTYASVERCVAAGLPEWDPLMKELN